MRIGVFDSGFGGCTVLQELLRVFPQHEYVYLGDNAHAPYGDRPSAEIVELTRNGLAYLFDDIRCDWCIAACNTVTIHGDLPKERVLGVVEATALLGAMRARRHVGILATTATIASGVYQETVQRHAPHIKITACASPEFVPLIEQGGQEVELRRYVHQYGAYLQNAGVDTVILGCTHYPLIRSYLQEILSGDVEIIESGEAFCHTYKDIFAIVDGTQGSCTMVTSANATWFAERITALLPELSLYEVTAIKLPEVRTEPRCLC